MSCLNTPYASTGPVLQCAQRCLKLLVFSVFKQMHQPFYDQMELCQVTFHNNAFIRPLLKVFFDIFNILVNPFELFSLHKRPPR